MITLEFLKEQLEAKPFLPFTVVTASGTRYQVKTPDHADLPPPDDETGERNGYFIVYNEHAIPRYLSVEQITALEHK